MHHIGCSETTTTKKNKVEPLGTTISWKRLTPAKLTSAQADVGREYMWDMDVGVQREEFGIGIAYRVET